MEVRQTPRQEAAPAGPKPSRPTAEASQSAVTVPVSVLNERPDEEEKEAGYGHGV